MLDQVKNFIDDGEDAEASPKQRAVVLGHNPELGLDSFKKKTYTKCFVNDRVVSETKDAISSNHLFKGVFHEHV